MILTHSSPVHLDAYREAFEGKITTFVDIIADIEDVSGTFFFQFV